MVATGKPLERPVTAQQDQGMGVALVALESLLETDLKPQLRGSSSCRLCHPNTWAIAMSCSARAPALATRRYPRLMP
jgi:hypothetical protein